MLFIVLGSSKLKLECCLSERLLYKKYRPQLNGKNAEFFEQYVHSIVTPIHPCTPLVCLCDCSKCDSSGLHLDSRNSSWSIARLKECLRRKRGQKSVAVQESRVS